MENNNLMEQIPIQMESDGAAERSCTILPPKKNAWRVPGCICAAVILVAAAAFFLTTSLRGYNRALKALARRDYAAAAEQFEDLGDYRDAGEQGMAARYEQAQVMLGRGEYDQALQILQKLGDYKASGYRMQQCHFGLGEAAMEEKDYVLAAEHFSQAQTTGAAPRKLAEAIYAQGHALFLEGEYDRAQEWFDKLEGEWPENGGPHFQDVEDALDYMGEQAKELPSVLTVVVKDMPGKYVLRQDLLNCAIQQHMGYQFADVIYDEKTCTVTVVPSYYPGQRILYAWQTGDMTVLDEEETKTYHKAVELALQATESSRDPIGAELWIHNWICENVIYDSPYMYVSPEEFVELRELTCVGAILDGIANCQGYTDAFHVLGTMAGLDVCKVFGAYEEEGHCWNGVRLDGRLYLVDVTFDDSLGEAPEDRLYIWFNNAMDLDGYSVFGGSDQFDALVFMKDLSKTYYSRNEMVFDELGDAVLELLRDYRKNGPGVGHAVVDTPNLDQDDFFDAVGRKMGYVGISYVQWAVLMETYETDTYLYVQWM